MQRNEIGMSHGADVVDFIFCDLLLMMMKKVEYWVVSGVRDELLREKNDGKEIYWRSGCLGESPNDFAAVVNEQAVEGILSAASEVSSISKHHLCYRQRLFINLNFDFHALASISRRRTENTSRTTGDTSSRPLQGVSAFLHMKYSSSNFLGRSRNHFMFLFRNGWASAVQKAADPCQQHADISIKTNGSALGTVVSRIGFQF